MKPMLIVLSLCMAASVSAQNNVIPVSQTANPTGGMIYSLPKAVLSVEIEVIKTTQKPGKFYNYAAKYLGTKDVILENKTFYTIGEIKVVSQIEADPQKTYMAEGLYDLQLTPKGILWAINTNASTYRNNNKVKAEESVKHQPKDFDYSGFSEEMMIASSDARTAELIAKQIYTLRERKGALAGGEAEKMPQDGESFKTALATLSTMEQGLIEHFIGINDQEKTIVKVEFTPEESKEKQLLFRFSKIGGVVDKNDVSGSPYYLTVKERSLAFKNKPRVDLSKKIGIVYRMPATALVELTDGKETLFSKTFYMPQFGQLNAFPAGFFSKEKKAIFSPYDGTVEKVFQ